MINIKHKLLMVEKAREVSRQRSKERRQRERELKAPKEDNGSQDSRTKTSGQ